MRDPFTRNADHWRSRVLEAELLALPPESVYRRYEQLSDESYSQATYEGLDPRVEERLLARNEPLITLALARFTCHQETARELVGRVVTDRAAGYLTEDSPVMLALLANERLAALGLGGVPFVVELAMLANEGLKMSDSSRGTLAVKWDAIEPWLASASPSERRALFENPTLDAAWLEGCVEGNNGWKEIPAGEQRSLASVAAHALKRRQPVEVGRFNGFEQVQERALTRAFWTLAERVPVDKEWAITLSWMFEDLSSKSVGDRTNWLQIAARWSALDAGFGVRFGIGRLLLEMYPSGAREQWTARLLASEDEALRAAACAFGSLSIEQMEAAIQRDCSSETFDALGHNPGAWAAEMKPRETLDSLRERVLEGASSDPARLERYEDLDLPRSVWDIEETMRERHPLLFVDEVDEDEFDETKVRPVKPATNREAVALHSHARNLSQQLVALDNTAKELAQQQSKLFVTIHTIRSDQKLVMVVVVAVAVSMFWLQ